MSRFRVGETVQVRDESEILGTLDKEGTLEGLPFMPVMWDYCGKRFKVKARVKKLIIEGGVGMRRIRNTVILDGAECDGEAYDGCDRTCPLLWREAWLKKPEMQLGMKRPTQMKRRVNNQDAFRKRQLHSSRCQSVSLIMATSPLYKWDIRQYLWDIRSARFGPIERFKIILTTLHQRASEFILRKRRKALLGGRLRRTPSVALDLRAGDLVEVKGKEEILTTLDVTGRNRGLEFTAEMLKYCNRRFRVLKRLEKMMIEMTGELRLISNTVLLDGVRCDGKSHGGCQRDCYCLWREIWLRKIPESTR